MARKSSKKAAVARKPAAKKSASALSDIFHGLLKPRRVAEHAPSHAAFHGPAGGGAGNARLHPVMASSFADPADVAAFRACKAEGHNDDFCFRLGDNGIGFNGDDCTGPTPMCALPREDWQERWGSKANARLKPVVVTANGRTVVCLLGDTMPSRANIRNGAGIDLSPAAVRAIGKSPPLMIPAVWSWQDDE